MQEMLQELSRNHQVKEYIKNHFGQEPEEIRAARIFAKDSGLKEIHVPSYVGKVLNMVARLVRPSKILEIGTLGGYSSLWLARALITGGTLITLECNEENALIAEENIRRANRQHQIEVRHGMALAVLRQLIRNKEGPFDLIFIDADKENYHLYLELCLELSRPGTLILSDNLIPKRGDLGIPASTDMEAIGIYIYNQKLADHPRLDSILLPIIASKNGRIDALGLSIVN